MAFASSFSHGFRQGALRTSSKRSINASIRLCRSESRSFSSLLLASTSSGRTLAHIQTVGYSRSLSFWGSKSTPTPPATTPIETPKAEETSPDSGVTATTGEKASGSVVDSSIPVDASAIPVDSSTVANVPADASLLSDVAEAVTTHIPAALQYGDLAAMGLASWSPAGLVRWSLEIINVSTGMPWLWTIVAGSLFWRLVCVPFALKGLQASARMQPHQAELVKLQAEIQQTTQKKDPIAMQLAGLKMKQFYKDHNINPLGGVVSLLQMPITLGVFFGVQTLCKLPLEQLHFSGVSLFPDLTIADPTYILPLALCALINTQIAVSARDINTVEKPGMGHLLNVFRLLSIPGVYFMAHFPLGLIISLLTTSSLSTVQSFILRAPAVRRWLDIPIPPTGARGQLPSMLATFRYGKSWFKDEFINKKLAEARLEAQRRQQAARQPPRRL